MFQTKRCFFSVERNLCLQGFKRIHRKRCYFALRAVCLACRDSLICESNALFCKQPLYLKELFEEALRLVLFFQNIPVSFNKSFVSPVKVPSYWTIRFFEGRGVTKVSYCVSLLQGVFLRIPVSLAHDNVFSTSIQRR